MRPHCFAILALLPLALPASAGAKGDVSSSTPQIGDDPVLHRVTPAIPFGVENYEHTRQAHCEVDVKIDRKGRPKQIEVSGCVPCYESVTKQAVHQWRFRPGTKSYHTGFDFQVEVTDPEPSEPVMDVGDDPAKLSVNVSIPVLSMVMHLNTQRDDDWPPSPPRSMGLLQRATPNMDRVSSVTLRELQNWYGLSEHRCNVEIWVDEQGEARDWRAIDCSEHFHQTLNDMLETMRWEPLVEIGVPQAFTTRFMVAFQFISREDVPR